MCAVTSSPQASDGPAGHGGQRTARDWILGAFSPLSVRQSGTTWACGAVVCSQWPYALAFSMGSTSLPFSSGPTGGPIALASQWNGNAMLHTFLCGSRCLQFLSFFGISWSTGLLPQHSSLQALITVGLTSAGLTFYLALLLIAFLPSTIFACFHSRKQAFGIYSKVQAVITTVTYQHSIWHKVGTRKQFLRTCCNMGSFSENFLNVHGCVGVKRCSRNRHQEATRGIQERWWWWVLTCCTRDHS